MGPRARAVVAVIFLAVGAATAGEPPAESEQTAKAARLERAQAAAARLVRETGKSGRYWIREALVNDLAPEILQIEVNADAWLSKKPLGREKTVWWLQRQWARVNAAECPEKPNHCQLWIYARVSLRVERVAWTDALGGLHWVD